MDKSHVFDTITELARHTEPALNLAVMTKLVVLCEFALPDGELAFHRVTSTADGRSLVSWEVDGMLLTALTRGRASLGPLTDH